MRMSCRDSGEYLGTINQIRDRMQQKIAQMSDPVEIEKVKIPSSKSDIRVEAVALARLPL